MKIYTEKEFNNQSQHFAFKYRNLYLKDPSTFFDLQDYLPFPLYINERENLEYHFYNESFVSLGKEIENLMINGFSYLSKISNPVLLKHSIVKAKLFHKNNDYDNVCNYLQAVLLNGKITPYITNKILINDSLTLNIPFIFSKNTIFEKVFKELLPYGEENLNNWLRFQTLTKREKEILKLIAAGNSNKTVSELLFISQHSVKTHRRNIYRKLDIHKTSQLVRLAILLEILD